MAEFSVTEQHKIIESESNAYLERIAQQREWTGKKKELQVLWLPSSNSTSLPTYPEQTDFLDPSHCRLCLQPVGPSELEKHLRESHTDKDAGYSTEEYRTEILRKALTSWPETIQPSVLRTRLAAFRKELSDANFLERPCTCRARNKRQCKLLDVYFPPRGAEIAPGCLPWNAVE